MNRLLFLTITIGVMTIAAPVKTFALNTSSEERICTDLGFKPRTEKHGNCVLELLNRSENKTRASKNIESEQARQTEQARQAEQARQVELDNRRKWEEYRQQQQQRDAEERRLQRAQEEEARQEQIKQQEQERIEKARKQWDARCSFEKRNAYNQWIESKKFSCDGLARQWQPLCGLGILNGAENQANSAYESCMSGFPY